jgi:hypothetical protein
MLIPLFRVCGTHLLLRLEWVISVLLLVLLMLLLHFLLPLFFFVMTITSVAFPSKVIVRYGNFQMNGC